MDNTEIINYKTELTDKMLASVILDLTIDYTYQKVSAHFRDQICHQVISIKTSKINKLNQVRKSVCSK